MKRVGVRTFVDGSNTMKAHNLLEEIEQNFKLMKVPEEMRSQITRSFLFNNAGELYISTIKIIIRIVISSTIGIINNIYLRIKGAIPNCSLTKFTKSSICAFKTFRVSLSSILVDFFMIPLSLNQSQ